MIRFTCWLVAVGLTFAWQAYYNWRPDYALWLLAFWVFDDWIKGLSK